MKKFIFGLMAVCAMALISSCGSSEHKTVEEDTTEDALTDTTNVVCDTVEDSL